jgi:hypothetical protein
MVPATGVRGRPEPPRPAGSGPQPVRQHHTKKLTVTNPTMPSVIASSRACGAGTMSPNPTVLNVIPLK